MSNTEIEYVLAHMSTTLEGDMIAGYYALDGCAKSRAWFTTTWGQWLAENPRAA